MFMPAGMKKQFRKPLNHLEIQKDYPLGYQILGNAYLGMGRNEEAIKTHLKLAEVDPDNLICPLPDIYCNRSPGGS